MQRNTQAGRLRFTADLGRAVEEALVIFLAVGTPAREGGSADLSFIEEAARSAARHMNGYKVVVSKSTVAVGTGERLRRLIRESLTVPHNFGIVSNPDSSRERDRRPLRGNPKAGHTGGLTRSPAGQRPRRRSS